MLHEETLYARFLSGELTKKEEDELKENGDWEKLEKISNASSEFSLPAIDKNKGFNRLVEARTKSRQNIKKLNYGIWLPVAAGIALLIGAWFFWPSQLVSIDAPLATKTEHIFIDGTKVILNAGSRLSFNENDWQQSREVELIGEAYFQVESGVPFNVVMDNASVAVLGTAFNIKSWEKDIVVECYEGKVGVNYNVAEKFLTAFQGVYLSDGEIRDLEINSNVPEWMEGRSKFRNETFKEVANELERQYKIQVISTVDKLRFSGSFVHEDLLTAVDQISKPLGIKANISADMKQVTFSH